MSLNRSEQMLSDYLMAHPEERRYWEDKVRRTTGAQADPHEAARLLEGDLWYYYVERSDVVPDIRDSVSREGGLHRTSMRNLAEYLMRLWVPLALKPKKKSRRA